MNILLAILLAILIAAVEFADVRVPWDTGRPDDAGTATTAGSGRDPVTTCPQFFQGETLPSMAPSSDDRTIMLCNDSYASFSSSETRTPLWVAERLTRDVVMRARNTERASDFDEDERLPRGGRARLKDYRGSGWDRGHLAPSADMPDPTAQDQSFLLSNIAPQDPDLNRGRWADLERDVRSLAMVRDEVFVVTGLLFDGRRPVKVPSGRVSVPASFWKAVASPTEGSVVFVATNGPGTLVPMTVAEFGSRYGIDPFPALTARDRDTMLEMRR